MKLRYAFFTVAAIFHLILVASSAAHVRLFSPDSPIDTAVDHYGSLSGSDNSYAFFAPGVAPEFRVTFTLTDSDGNTWEESGNQGATREAELRYDSMTSMFTFRKLRGRIAASWAATMFGKHPNAERVEVAVEAQDMPTMEAYRDGYRPEWSPVYTTAFTRNQASDKAESAREPAVEETEPAPQLADSDL
jgi:hypothetical protein